MASKGLAYNEPVKWSSERNQNMSHPSVSRLFQPAEWWQVWAGWLGFRSSYDVTDWRLLKYPTDVKSLKSFTWHVGVVWSSVTHGDCRFWTINPASIQPTPHISLSALQAFRSSSLNLPAPTTNSKNPLQIMGSVSRSAVFSLYSESVRLGLRKNYNGLKQRSWDPLRATVTPA